ncbi:MAG: type II secretion system F family protein [Verrucomicrobia bacterium]|nr:type II secretion system F family protein [Verrucomicrobiota bacterium]
MKTDEFAFFNQQLAAMLRDNIPLEGALRRLCQEMRRGALRTELLLLEADLANGTPLETALAARQLPELYKRMMLVGVKSGSLPGALTLLADYYQRQNHLWMRLKGLMVYPLIVLFATFAVSGLFVFIWLRLVSPAWFGFQDVFQGAQLPAATRLALPLMQNLWVFPTFFGLLLGLALAILFVPAWRDAVRWRLPAFREASVSRVAAALHLLLKGGVNLPESIGLVQRLEGGKAAADLQGWSRNLASGLTRFSEVAAGSRVFPPLFVWLVANASEDLTAGFQRAAEIYQSRAAYRTELALYAALPVAVLFLGAIILSEGYMLFSAFLVFVQFLGGM